MGKSAVPAILLILSAAFTAMADFSDDLPPKKDECLLIARNCGTSARSLQDKIEKLQEEIQKGKKVYTPQELRLLQQKLNEVEKVLDFLGDQPPYIQDAH